MNFSQVINNHCQTFTKAAHTTDTTRICVAHLAQLDDFDEGVVAQLNSKRTEDTAIAAVRHIANYDIASIQHMAAYINHIIKHFNTPNGASYPGTAPTGGASSIGVYGGQIRLASVPVSAKAMLAKLPLKVYRRLEEVVASCSYLEWHHLDAGVVKVLAQVRQEAQGQDDALQCRGRVGPAQPGHILVCACWCWQNQSMWCIQQPQTV